MERLEEGRGASLYRGERPPGSREPLVVAVRIADNPRDDRAAAWIRNEYDTLRAVDDPRVPRAYGYYATQAALALTLVDGASLAEAFAAQREGLVRVDPATAVDVLAEVAECLAAVHGVAGSEGPLIHGALCPERVVIDRDGRVFVLGLGLPPGDRVPGYTAPEQAAGAFTDPRTDQWALGALAVELLLGERLYARAEDPTEDALQGRVGASLDRIERTFPAMIRLLSRLLAPAAGGRYPSDRELMGDLLTAHRQIAGRPDRALLAQRVIAVRPPPPPAPPPAEAQPEPPSFDLGLERVVAAADAGPSLFGVPAAANAAAALAEPPSEEGPTSLFAAPAPAPAPLVGPAAIAVAVPVSEDDDASDAGAPDDAHGLEAAAAPEAVPTEPPAPVLPPLPALVVGATPPSLGETGPRPPDPDVDPTDPALPPRAGAAGPALRPAERLGLAGVGLLVLAILGYVVWRF